MLDNDDVPVVNKRCEIGTHLFIKRIFDDKNKDKINSEDLEDLLMNNSLRWDTVGRHGLSLVHILAGRPDLCTPAVIQHMMDNLTVHQYNNTAAIWSTEKFFDSDVHCVTALDFAMSHSNLALLNGLLHIGANPFCGVISSDPCGT